MVEYTISNVEAGKKVHRLVRQLLPGVPLSGVHKMIRTGRVKRNGKKAKPDDVLVIGDVLRIYMGEQDYANVSKQPAKYGGISTDIRLLYEDEDCLAVDKPGGLLTHGDRLEQKDTLVNRVLAYLYHRDPASDTTLFHPAPVNRLDRNTSGIVLFGKTAGAIKTLSQAIQEGTIRKWYLAIVKGQLPESGVIEGNLDRAEGTNRTTVAHDGKVAVTRYVVVGRSEKTCVAQIELLTGRTHQIRAHLAHVGCPLLDDVKYGGGAGARGSAGEALAGSQSGVHQWLHAAWVLLPNGQLVSSALPGPFRQRLKRLGYRDHDVEALSMQPRID